MSRQQTIKRFLIALVAHVVLLFAIKPALGLFSTYRDPYELLLMFVAALVVGIALAVEVPLLWRGSFPVRCAAALLCVYPFLILTLCVERHLS